MTSSPPLLVLLLSGLTVGCAGRERPAEALAPAVAGELRSPDAFAHIRPRRDRSIALFQELHRVLVHPRCINCHPTGDVPHRGPNLALHDPPVVRGDGNFGVVGMTCNSCHLDRNQDLALVPGAPGWRLAPLEMGWVGLTPGQICEQLKDPARNGGKTLEQLVEHNGQDDLIGWGWAPGAGREPAPGTQEQFGALTAAWVEAGAHCPAEGSSAAATTPPGRAGSSGAAAAEPRPTRRETP